MSDNPWEEKGRIHWKKDPEFLKYNDDLFTNTFESFDEVCEFCTTSRWPWNGSGRDSKWNELEWVNVARDKWRLLTNRWKLHNNTNKLPRFAAITLHFVVLPYEKLGSNIGEVLTEFEAQQINTAYFYEIGQYEFGGPGIPVKNMDDLSRGPLLPAAWQQWLDNKYNEASWWLACMVYERQNKLSPIIDDDPAQPNTSSP